MKVSYLIRLIILYTYIYVTACTSMLEQPSITKVKSTYTQAVISPTDTPGYITVDTKNNASGNADVTHVRAVQQPDGLWTFHVTVSHPDTGWEDYTDGWDVVLQDGEILNPNPDTPFTRLLLHPHVNEQPFTRSQSGIKIPDGVTRVIVRAHDLVDGFGGKVIEVDLTKSSGPGFEVDRKK